MPSQIMFHIALFPNNVPLPAPQKSAWILGGLMHILHFAVRVSQISKAPSSDPEWADIFDEEEDGSWFDWVSSCYALLSPDI